MLTVYPRKDFDYLTTYTGNQWRLMKILVL